MPAIHHSSHLRPPGQACSHADSPPPDESPDESPEKIVTGDSPFRRTTMRSKPFAQPSRSANHHHQEESPVSVVSFFANILPLLSAYPYPELS